MKTDNVFRNWPKVPWIMENVGRAKNEAPLLHCPSYTIEIKWFEQEHHMHTTTHDHE